MLGSPPNSRTTTSVALPSSQVNGRDTVASMFSGEATSPDHCRAYCIPSRFGASSPTTRLTAVRMKVMSAIATTFAASPRKLSDDINGWPRVTAAVADAR